MRRRRDAFLDDRITERSIALFRQAKEMLRQGYTFDSRDTPPVQLATYAKGVKTEPATLMEVSRALDRELGLRPWMPSLLDFETSVMEASRFQPHAAFATVQELHRKLLEASGDLSVMDKSKGV